MRAASSQIIGGLSRTNSESCQPSLKPAGCCRLQIATDKTQLDGATVRGSLAFQIHPDHLEILRAETLWISEFSAQTVSSRALQDAFGASQSAPSVTQKRDRDWSHARRANSLMHLTGQICCCLEVDKCLRYA